MARSAGSACSPRMPFTRSHGAAPAPSSADAFSAAGQRAQPLPARVEERGRARLVAVERRAGPVAAVDTSNSSSAPSRISSLRKAADLERELTQRVVEGTIAHAGGFASRAGVPAERAVPG